MTLSDARDLETIDGAIVEVKKMVDSIDRRLELDKRMQALMGKPGDTHTLEERKTEKLSLERKIQHLEAMRATAMQKRADQARKNMDFKERQARQKQNSSQRQLTMPGISKATAGPESEARLLETAPENGETVLATQTHTPTFHVVESHENKTIVVVIEVPFIKSMDGISLELNANGKSLAFSSKYPTAALEVHLPQTAQSGKIAAKFSRKRKTLKVTLPYS
jgi:hypothetical protein